MKGGDNEIQGVVGMTNGRGCEVVGLLVDTRHWWVSRRGGWWLESGSWWQLMVGSGGPRWSAVGSGNLRQSAGVPLTDSRTNRTSQISLFIAVLGSLVMWLTMLGIIVGSLSGITFSQPACSKDYG